MAAGRTTSRAWARASEKRSRLSNYAALDQVVNAVQTNKLPPTALLPALKSSMSPLQLQKELGITGTTNFRGDLLTESNAKLVHQLAFGQPGNRTWGEWESILMTDPAVAVSDQHTRMQIRDALLEVEPANPDLFTDRALAQKQADFVRWNLFAAMEPGWSAVAQQMVGAINFGFSMHELVAGTVKHPLLPGGSGYKLAKLSERLPVSVHPMGWVEDPETRDLTAVRQWGSYPGTGAWYETVIPASKLLLYSWNRRGNNYLGFPAWRAVWYWCKARVEIAKLVPISLIREGAGVPTAFSKDKEAELDAKSRRRLEKLLANMVYHENANAVLPAGWELGWFTSGASANKGHIVQVYNDVGTIIMQQVMAQHLALGVQGNTGNRSLGQTQTDVSDLFVDGLLASICDTVNGTHEGARPYEGLVPKMVQWNWGPQPAYPTVKMGRRRGRMPAGDYAKGIQTLKAAGAITVWSHEDENSSREHFGLKPVDAEEFEAEKQRVADEKAAELESLQKKPPAPGSPKANAIGRTAPTGAGGPPSKLSAGDSFTPRRPLRPSEQVLALADIAAFYDDARDRFERGARPLVAELLAKALPDVKEAMKDGDPSELATVKLDTERLEAFIGDFIQKARDFGYRQVANEARKQRVAGLAADDRSPPEDDEEEQLLYEAMRKQATRQLEARLRTALESEAIEVIRTGGKPSEVVGRVSSDELQGGGGLAQAAGMITAKALNMGRDEFAQEYADAVESVELSSVLDDGTCTYCESMDGTEFDFNSSGHDAYTPPLRDCEGRGRCRCILIYNFRSNA